MNYFVRRHIFLCAASWVPKDTQSRQRYGPNHHFCDIYVRSIVSKIMHFFVGPRWRPWSGWGEIMHFYLIEQASRCFGLASEASRRDPGRIRRPEDGMVGSPWSGAGEGSCLFVVVGGLACLIRSKMNYFIEFLIIHFIFEFVVFWRIQFCWHKYEMLDFHRFTTNLSDFRSRNRISRVFLGLRERLWTFLFFKFLFSHFHRQFWSMSKIPTDVENSIKSRLVWNFSAVIFYKQRYISTQKNARNLITQLVLFESVWLKFRKFRRFRSSWSTRRIWFIFDTSDSPCSTCLNLVLIYRF